MDNWFLGELPGLIEAELRGSLALLKDEGRLGRWILEVEVRLVVGFEVVEAAINAPGELEEGSSRVGKSEAGMVRGAKLLEVDTGSNFDDISILDDSMLDGYPDGGDVREAAPECDGVLEYHTSVDFEVGSCEEGPRGKLSEVVDLVLIARGRPLALLLERGVPERSPVVDLVGDGYHLDSRLFGEVCLRRQEPVEGHVGLQGGGLGGLHLIMNQGPPSINLNGFRAHGHAQVCPNLGMGTNGLPMGSPGRNLEIREKR